MITSRPTTLSCGDDVHEWVTGTDIGTLGFNMNGVFVVQMQQRVVFAWRAWFKTGTMSNRDVLYSDRSWIAVQFTVEVGERHLD